MIRAYDETYLPDAMTNLAGAFDYVANDWGLDLDMFIDFFLASPLCMMFEDGVPKAVCGMSGQELAMEIMAGSGFRGCLNAPTASMRVDASAEYWCGWVLAYCQWATGIRFGDILSVLPVAGLLALYPTLHEADEERVVDLLRSRIAQADEDEGSRLGSTRVLAGMSQRELASRSGVSLRSIQMYEQRRKNINKASVSTVLALARVLGCSIEDLLELE